MSPETLTDPDAIAEKVIETLEEYQRLSIGVISADADDPEAAVKGLVGLHLTWTADNAETSRLISRHRHEVITGPHRERLMASNREFFTAMKTWIDRQAETGRLPAVSFNLLHAVIFAPTQEIAKLWLAGRLKKPLSEYAGPLGDAAWAGLLALPERRQPGTTATS
ncbi:MAG TPA: hypothetical protein VMF31_00860 [Solirubrobacterales bacterium]|nr:hypothetical protein [Solirubrobacterales bacterium]